MKGRVKVFLTTLCTLATMALSLLAGGCSVGNLLEENDCVHNFGAVGIVEQEPTCTVEGVELFTCRLCGETKEEPIAVLEHDWSSESTVTKEATCTVEGEKEFTCLREGCNEKKTAKIATKEHTRVEVGAILPTCTRGGMTDYVYCSECNNFLSPKMVITALGHSPEVLKAVAAMCTTSGKTAGKQCKTCGLVLEAQTSIPALGHHIVDDPAIEGTCGDGLTAGKHCDRCGYVYVAQEVIPGDQNHADPVNVSAKAATCTEAGYSSGTKCSKCLTVLTGCVEIPATGHTEVAIPDVAATCTTPGKVGGTKCSVCNVVITPQYDTALAEHSYNEAYECTICGYEYFTEGLNYMLSLDESYYVVSGVSPTYVTDDIVVIPRTYNGKPVGGITNIHNVGGLKGLVVRDNIMIRYNECGFEPNILDEDGRRSLEKLYFDAKIDEMLYGINISIGLFEGCYNLYEVTLGENVNYIVKDMFKSCGSLRRLNILGDIDMISSNAFIGCGDRNNGMAVLIEKDITIEYEYYMGYSPFNGATIDYIGVPKEAYNLYVQAWEDNADNIVAEF